MSTLKKKLIICFFSLAFAARLASLYELQIGPEENELLTKLKLEKVLPPLILHLALVTAWNCEKSLNNIHRNSRYKKRKNGGSFHTRTRV